MTFSLRTFLLVAVVSSLCAVYCLEHFGFTQPPRRIRSIIIKIDGFEEPIDYRQFIDDLDLPEGSEVPPGGGVYGGSYYWDFDHGFRMDTQFDYRGDGRLEYVTIYSVSDTDQVRFAWQWVHGKTVPLSRFWEAQLAR